MDALIGSNFIVRNPTDELRQWCAEHLVIDNPDYIKLTRMKKWTGNTPRYLQLYVRYGATNETPEMLVLPFGCSDLLRQFPMPFKVLISPLRAVQYHPDIKLYPYQEEAVEAALKYKNGILVMPCGAGKTITGLSVIARIGGRALWLTHTQDLLNQSLDKAKSIFNDDVKSYGTITAGKVNVGSSITFATIQTLAKVDLSDLKDAFDIIVVDECHHACGSPTRVTQFYKVLNAFSARYKYGLTATPKRADGLELSMFTLLGKVIHTVHKEAVENTTCPVVYRPIETGYFPNTGAVLAGDGTLNYAALIDDLTHDEQRFQLVSNALNELDGIAIVLGNRVEYLQRLCDNYSGRAICLSTLGTSKSAKALRKNTLQKLNDGELCCVFATYQLAKEGLDVPNLRYVVFSTPEKDETTITQSAGRVGRKADGKDHGTVIDFVDDFGMYRGWYKKRVRYYKKMGATEELN